MNFSILQDVHKKWRDLRVIGRTAEHNGQKRHIIGMTLEDNTARIYILEPADEPPAPAKKKTRTHRQSLKACDNASDSYLDCREFHIGGRTFQVQSGCGSPLRYLSGSYAEIQIFFDMMRAGWTAPAWLQHMDWDDLQLLTLTVGGIVRRLPKCASDTPITIIHRPRPDRHILEKTLTLQVGHRRSFTFTDHLGDKVTCRIRNVELIDMRNEFEISLNNPKYTRRMTPEQLWQIQTDCLRILDEHCPKGMLYASVDYECSKDLTLQFYAKSYLNSRLEDHRNRSVGFFMGNKAGYSAHDPLLRSCLLQTPFSPDTTIIPAELFCYIPKAEPWTETVCGISL